MPDTLLIHYNLKQPEHAVWSLMNSQGELSAKITHGPLDNAADMAANSSKVVVLLDSACLHFNKVLLPTQNRQKMLRAVPYALEEQIAEDIDDFHFVIDRPGNDGKIPVVGINRKTLENMLQIFNTAGIYPDAVVPDAVCLAADDRQWAMLYFEDKVYIQFDALYGGLFDRDMATVVLGAALKQYQDHIPEKIIIFSIENDTTDDLTELAANDIELISVHYNTHPLVVFCGQIGRAMSLNLLRDKYKPGRRDGMQWGKWNLAASLAALWLGLHLGTSAVQYYDLKEKNSRLGAQINDIYRQTFPQSQRVVNARVQMEQKLKELRGDLGSGSSSIIDLLTDSAGALAGEKNITIESINYRNNRIEISLISKNLQAIESLNRSLNNNTGLRAEITSSTSEKDSVRGNIRLQKAET